jgi:hypothetical protein
MRIPACTRHCNRLPARSAWGCRPTPSRKNQSSYAFVRAGIPALYLDGGVIPAASSAGKEADLHTVPKLAQRDFLRRCYHQPCDDVSLPIQYGDAVRLARLNVQLGLVLDNAATPAHWNAGDFFGDRFAQP